MNSYGYGQEEWKYPERGPWQDTITEWESKEGKDTESIGLTCPLPFHLSHSFLSIFSLTTSLFPPVEPQLSTEEVLKLTIMLFSWLLWPLNIRFWFWKILIIFFLHAELLHCKWDLFKAAVMFLIIQILSLILSLKHIASLCPLWLLWVQRKSHLQTEN